MRYQIILCVIVINFICCNDPNVIFNKDYYSNGSLKLVTRKYLFEKKTCKEYYYKNGKILKKYYLVNEKIDGIYTEFYDTGVLKKEINYRSGLAYGKWVQYYSNGEIESNHNYKKGKRDKYQYTYNEDGKLEVINYCVNDTSYYIKQFFDKGDTVKIIEDFIPSIYIPKDTLIVEKDTFSFQFNLPIPDSLIYAKELSFYYDVVKYTDDEANYRFPKERIEITNNKIIEKKFFMTKSGKLVFHGAIFDTKGGKEIQYSAITKTLFVKDREEI